MRKYVVDTHVHTIASGHAYSTLQEYVDHAKDIGLEMFALTDHGPEMPGGPHAYHIANQNVIPREIEGIKILRGVEVNIMDFEGTLDINDNLLSKLDIVIASLHPPCIKPGTKDENTKALINTMKTGLVDIIGHSGNPDYPINIEEFIKAAKEYNVAVEINNSSHLGGTRAGSWDNCVEIAKIANKHKVHLLTSSDAHYKTLLGNFEKSIEIFEAAGVDEELILTTSVKKVQDFLNNRRTNG